MSGISEIEWTDATWNPVTGCTKVSPGCAHCYAETFAERFRGVPGHPYEQGFDLKIWEERLQLPLSWKKPRLIFVNSMSDLFHKDVPDDFIFRVFRTMNEAHWHTFQVLTKRPERMQKLNKKLSWSPNIWAGVSIESDKYVHRADKLRMTDAAIKFLSLEPLLGPVSSLDLKGIHWVIVGGESGRGARPMSEPWVKEIHGKCKKQKVAFFFKQWGGINKKRNGRTIFGTTWN